MSKLLGKITFECEVNGKIEMTVTRKGSKVFTHTELKYSSTALTHAKNGDVMLKPSVIFSMFETLIEAQKAKGK